MTISLTRGLRSKGERVGIKHVDKRRLKYYIVAAFKLMPLFSIGKLTIWSIKAVLKTLPYTALSPDLRAGTINNQLTI